jgi:hypothetical protein
MARLERDKKRLKKVQKSLDLDEIAKDITKCGHHAESSAYPPYLIMQLRMYYQRLGKADQRQFLSPGVRCDLDQDRINRGGNLSCVKLHKNYRLEQPLILADRLTLALLCPKYRLPVPAPAECHQVCQKFLHHAVGRSVAFTNRGDKMHKSKENFMNAEDRVHQCNPPRAEHVPRVATKTKLVVEWLNQQRKEHLVLPNEDATVLPYTDRREAHAMFVLDTERVLGVPFADASRNLCFASGVALDDINADNNDHLQLDEVEAARANHLAQVAPSRCRYGNIGLGPKGQVPESTEIATFSWFMDVWRNAEDKHYRKTIKIRKWIPFAKCDQCAEYRAAKSTTKCPVERAELRCAQAAHIERVKRERLSYMIRQRLAITHPARYLSLIIDGADSSGYALPHFAYRSHKSDATHKVKMHVLGAIAHGRDTYAFTCPPHIAQGHNVTIQVLHRVLTMIIEAEGCLPPILHIQLDNTTKQNKGRFLMAYLGYLVQQGVVREVYCNFLPVGHTHEDIDQFFSRLSVWCRRHDIPCPKDLLFGIRCCMRKYGKAPVAEQWTTVANLSSYFGPFTTPTLSKDITLYYHLKISVGRRDEIAGVPILQARTWPGSDPNDANDFWRGLEPDTSYVRIFKQTPQLLKNMDSVPVQAQPEHIGANASCDQRVEYKKNLARQREGIKGLMEAYPASFTHGRKEDMLALLDLMGSNLDPANPVGFAWTKDEMEFLYERGQYAQAAPDRASDQEANLYEDHDAMVAARAQPNNMDNPLAFQKALLDGLMDPRSVENCHACILQVLYTISLHTRYTYRHTPSTYLGE